jgi:hypothetical protein
MRLELHVLMQTLEVVDDFCPLCILTLADTTCQPDTGKILIWKNVCSLPCQAMRYGFG